MTTHITLKNDIDNWLARSDFTGAASTTTIVTMCEAEIARDIRVREQLTTGTLTASSRNTALPTGFLDARSVSLDVSYGRTLDYLTPEIMRESNVWDNSGNPQAYTIEGSNLVLAPAPSSSLTVDIVYYKRFTAFSDDSDTNWLLTNHYDIYLFCALKNACIYLQDFEGAEYYEAKLSEKKESLKTAQRGSQFNGSALVSRGSPRAIV